jgi:hypothetical protein
MCATTGTPQAINKDFLNGPEFSGTLPAKDSFASLLGLVYAFFQLVLLHASKMP